MSSEGGPHKIGGDRARWFDPFSLYPAAGRFENGSAQTPTFGTLPLIGIEIIADSLLNRLVKRARVITIKGPNMREVLANETKEKPGYWS